MSRIVVAVDLSMKMKTDGLLPFAAADAAALAAEREDELLACIGFSEAARVITVAELRAANEDHVLGTNLGAALRFGRELIRPPDQPHTWMRAGQMLIVYTNLHADRQTMPTGEIFMHYPPTRETLIWTTAEAESCIRAGTSVEIHQYRVVTERPSPEVTELAANLVGVGVTIESVEVHL